MGYSTFTNALDSDQEYIVYHAWDTNAGVGDRKGLIDKITWIDGWPAVVGGKPTEAAQPYP